MGIEFETIGKYACDKAEEYVRLIEEHKTLVHDRNEIDKQIVDAEVKGDSKKLEELYKRFREIHASQRSNACYRQKFCDEFLSKILEMMEEK